MHYVMAISLQDITYGSKDVHDEIYSRCDVKENDVLYIKDRATTGIATVNTITEPFLLLSSVAVLRPKWDLLVANISHIFWVHLRLKVK